MLREIESGIFLPDIQDFIFEKNNAVPKHFCDYLVAKFEDDTEGQNIGTMGHDYKNIDFKSTTDIALCDNKKWYDDVDIFLNNYIVPTFLEYYETLGTIKYHLLGVNGLDYDSIIIARYDVGGKFEWHCDQGQGATSRVFQIIAYLNDPEEGGETFYGVFDRKIKPEKGKVIIAPSSYPFFHKSCPVIKGRKYNIIMQLSYNR